MYASLSPFSEEYSSSSTGLNADTPQERLARFFEWRQCAIGKSWTKSFDYGTRASLEENRETFLAVCLHCNPVLDKEYSSLNDCKLIQLLWLSYPLTSNCRCTHSNPHLRGLAFMARRKLSQTILIGQECKNRKPRYFWTHGSVQEASWREGLVDFRKYSCSVSAL